MSCLFSFPAQSLGNREENSKEQTENKQLFPQHLGVKLKELLAWDAMECLWVQKVISQILQKKKTQLLKYKIPPSSDVSLRLKMLKVKRTMLEKHHQLLVLLL